MEKTIAEIFSEKFKEGVIGHEEICALKKQYIFPIIGRDEKLCNNLRCTDCQLLTSILIDIDMMENKVEED